MLKAKRILVGISAGIAAYKIPSLIRLLIKEGAEVQVVMTPSSKDFVAPLTLSTLSKNPVYYQYFDGETGEWNNHVELAKWADIFLIAPSTVNTLAKMANGQCDNLLLACYFSMPDPEKVYFAPAMDLDMYKHEQNQANIQKLIGFGNKLIDADYGELASGLEGKGRMAEIDKIVESLKATQITPWKGKKVLITAGPTYEEIDPVRYIGNYSSGKMGYALAEAFTNEGADVHLISGPTHLERPRGLNFIPVKSANEMFEAVKAEQDKTEVFILSAAVSDYKPSKREDEKIKKNESSLNIALELNPDILSYLGKHKNEGQLVIGFALETENEIQNAKEKLERKNADLIVLNSMKKEGAGFGHDTNQVVMIDRSNNSYSTELMSKKEIAKEILKYIQDNLL